MLLNVAWMRARVLLSVQFLIFVFLFLFSVSVLAEEDYEYRVAIQDSANNPSSAFLGPFSSKGDAIIAMRGYNNATPYLSYFDTSIYTNGTQVDYYKMEPEPVINGPWKYYHPSIGGLTSDGRPIMLHSEGDVISVWRPYYIAHFGSPICNLTELTPHTYYGEDHSGICVNRLLTDSQGVLEPHGEVQRRQYKFDVTYGSQCQNLATDATMKVCRERYHHCPEHTPYYVYGYNNGGNGPICRNGWLYAQIHSKLKSNPCPKTVGNPCSPETGNKLETETDFDQSGLSFSRYYQSNPLLADQGDTGNNWTHTYSARIFNTSYGGDIHVSNAKGQYEKYVPLNNATYVSYRVDGKSLHKETDAEGQIHWLLVSRSGLQRFLQKTGFDDGILVEIEDDNGKITELSYDENNRLSQVTSPFNRTIQFEYDANGLLSKITAPDGQDYQYTYDSYLSGQESQWRLTSVIYPDNTSRNYFYEDTRHPNHLTGITNEKGIRYGTYAYDAQGRVITSEHIDGQDSIQLVYHTDRTIVTDALGKETTYYLTQVGPYRTIERIEESGNSTSYTRDANGWLNQVTDKNGNVTQFDRNDRGLISRKVEAVGQPEVRETLTEWHPVYSKPTKITVPGKITTFSYDADGRLLMRQDSSSN